MGSLHEMDGLLQLPFSEYHIRVGNRSPEWDWGGNLYRIGRCHPRWTYDMIKEAAQTTNDLFRDKCTKKDEW